MSRAPIFDSPSHPLLENIAVEFADWMAKHRGQGAHHGFQKRYDQIKEETGMGATEITAESWIWQEDCNQDELWEEAVKCWKQSPGHWRVANKVHKAVGSAMKKGRNGIWYFVAIVAD